MSKELHLTKQQRNDLFKVAVQNRVDPARFKWSSIPASNGASTNTTKLTLTDDGEEYFFALKLYQGTQLVCTHFPNVRMIGTTSFSNWETLTKHFDAWMKIVAYEVQESDLWKELPKNPLLVSDPDSYSHEEKFTPAEATLIRERLKNIEEFIVKTAAVAQEDAAKIHQTFSYLTEKVDKLSKLDWKNVFAGEIIGMVATYAVEHYAAILTFCNSQLMPFFSEVLKLH